jgi:hypothetical protein
MGPSSQVRQRLQYSVLCSDLNACGCDAALAIDGRQFTYWEQEKDRNGTLNEATAQGARAWYSVALNATKKVSSLSWTCYTVDWCPQEYEVRAQDSTGKWLLRFTDSNALLHLGRRDGRPLVSAVFSPFESKKWAIVFTGKTANGKYWHSIRELSITQCDTFVELPTTACPNDAVFWYNANGGNLNASPEVRRSKTWPMGDFPYKLRDLAKVCPGGQSQFNSSRAGGALNFEK